MSKDEIAEANRRIRIVLRKHGLEPVSEKEPEVWKGKAEGEEFVIEIRNGEAKIIRRPVGAWKADELFEDLAGAEI